MPAEVTQNTEIDPNAQSATGEQTNDASKPDQGTAGEQQQAPQGEENSGERAAPKTPLEAAKRVMAKEQKQSSDVKSQTESQPANPDAKAKGEGDDEKLPFKDHPKWREISSENRILKVAKEKNEEAIKVLEPKARTLDELSGWLNSNGLGQEDFASALTIMQAIRNDPAKALELLQPVLGELENLVGVRLPPDLQAKVASGELSPEYAQELSRARGGERLARSKAESYEQRMARESEDRRRGDEEAQLNGVVDTINAAEAEWRKRDPDAAKLRPLLEAKILAVGGMEPPRSNEDAHKLFEDCLAAVKKEVAGFVPSPRAMTGVLPASGASTTQVAQVPKSSLDAARAALNPG